MKAIGQLDHPNVVHAYDAREIDGKPVLVMEYVEGLDLAKLVRRIGPIGTADACELARQTALGLQYAHEHGLVHRDVKPSNLMLTPDGQVKILDLGLARFRACEPAGEEMTGTGQAMGTADYMAPEQASDSHAVDVRADLYAIDSTAKPGKIDFVGDPGPTLGIYRIEGDRLMICCGMTRPTDFLLDSGNSDRALFVLVRDTDGTADDRAEAQREQPSSGQKVVVDVDYRGRYSVDGRRHDIESLEGMLRDIIGEGRQCLVQIRLDPYITHHGPVQTLANLATFLGAGITAIEPVERTSPPRLDLRISPIWLRDLKSAQEELQLRHCIEALRTGGPDRDTNEPYAWFATGNEFGENLILMAHDDANYALLCTAPEDVMLATDEGDRGWSLSGAAMPGRGIGPIRTDSEEIHLQFDEAGARRLADLSERHVGSPLAVLIDDEVVFVPVIRSELASRLTIAESCDYWEILPVVNALNAALVKPDDASSPQPDGEKATGDESDSGENR